MKKCLMLTTVISLFANVVGMGLAPPLAAAAPVTGQDFASVDLLPLWFTDMPADPDTYTDGAGRYRFENLPHGTHKVTLDLATLPSHLRPAEGEVSPILWLTPGQEQASDALSSGVRFTAVYDGAGGDISGLVFLDLDGDGWPGPDEPGIPDVRVIDPTVHQYFVPFDDRDLWTLFVEKDQCHAGETPAQPLKSSVFLTSGSDGTVYYYDHWEDSYDADPLDPGPTTEVGVLDAGVTQLFQSDIYIDQLGTELYYDGRDRITIFGEEGAVVRLAYPSEPPGTLLAAAWEVPEAANWGAEYVATVGQDLDFNGETIADDHDYAGLEVMAWQDSTDVYYKSAWVETLDAGEVYFVSGGVNSADTITATAPIQVQMMTGGCGDAYSAHGYTLQPMSVWDDAYWAPVPGFTCKGVDTDIYLHNPNSNSISVTVVSNLGTVNVSIPATTTTSLLDQVTPGWTDISTGTSGIHLFSEDIFWGMAVIDSSTNGVGTGASFDWAYSLVPESELSSQVVVGYAPGNGDASPLDNGNSAFVTAITDTVIYVDLNQDGLPDPFDMNGDGDRDDDDAWGVPQWDESLAALGVPIAAGQSLRVGDPNDKNLMGAIIYTMELDEKFAVAWGQDPCQADTGAPYLDLGYTILPLPVSSLSKRDELAVDADLTGDVSPGDVLTYTMILHNSGLGSMNKVVLTDTLPYTYTDFVVGSLHVTTPPPTDTIEYYDGASWGPTSSTDAQAFRVKWDTLQPDGTVTVTFRVELHVTIPTTVTEITNRAVVDSANTAPRLSEDPNDPADPDTDTTIGRPLFSIEKNVDPDTVHPGELLTYTITVANPGTGIARGLAITDLLPEGIEYVSGTLDITWPSVRIQVRTRPVTRTAYFHGYYADDFDLSDTQTTGYAGNDGNLDWISDWTEYNDDSGDEVRVMTTTVNALSEPAYLLMKDDDEDDAGAGRMADLSEFISPTLRYYVHGFTGNGDDQYCVEINGIDLSTEAYNGGYALREFREELSAYAVNPVTLTFLALSGMELSDRYRFDNIAIYEANPERVETDTLTWERMVLSYTTSTGGDPVSYDPLTGQMVITQEVRLPAGGIITITFQAQAASPLTDSLTLSNTVCTTATNWLLYLSPPCDSVPVEIESSHTLTLTKTGDPDQVVAGRLLTYTLAYTASGDGTAPNAVITDAVPAGAIFITATGGIAVDHPLVGGSGVVTWHLGTLLTAGGGITYTTGEVTLVVQVNVDWTSSSITNTAWIMDDAGALDSAGETTAVDTQGINLSLDKSSEPAPAIPGEAITYTLVVANAGPGEITVITLTENLPAAVLTPTYAPSEGGYDSATGIWTGLALGAGDHVTLTIIGMVDPSFTGTLQNMATITPGGDTDTDDNPSAPRADLSISKLSEPDPVIAGETLTYTLTVSNTGPSDAQDVVVTDTLPGEVTFVDATLPHTYSDPDVVWDLGTLAVGETRQLTVVVTVNAGANGAITNIAAIGSSTPDPDPGSDDEEEDTEVNTSADVSLEKTASSSTVAAGETLTYTLTVSNAGPSDAQDVVVTDTLPGEVAFVDATSPHVYSDPDVVWDLGTLAGGETRQLTVVVTVNADISGTITNIATVESSTPDPDPGDDDEEEDTEVDTWADVSLKKTASSSTVAAGETLTYTLTVSNAGPSDAQDVVVTDTLPGEVAFVDATLPHTYSDPDVVWDLGTLAVGETRQFTVVVTVNADISGTITNIATVESSTPDPDPGDDEEEEDTEVDTWADVSLKKTASSRALIAEQTLIYTLTVSNAGPSNAHDVVVTDTLPGEVTFVDATLPHTYSDPDVVWDLGALAVGETRQFTVVVMVDVGISGITITNIATVASSTPDPNPDNNDDEEEGASADILADVWVEKSVEPTTMVLRGDVVTWTISYGNQGVARAMDVYITDTLPASAIYGGVVSQESSILGPVETLPYLTWYTSSLAAGALGTIVFTVTVGPNANVALNNSVAITTTTSDSDSGNDGASAVVEVQTQTDLAISKSVVRVLIAVTYTIEVRNLGPNDADEAIVADEIAAHIDDVFWTCVSSGGATCTSNGSGNDIHDTLLDFPVGGVVTYTVEGRLDIFDDESNVAEVIVPTWIFDLNNDNNRAVVGKPYRILLVLVYRNYTP